MGIGEPSHGARSCGNQRIFPVRIENQHGSGHRFSGLTSL